MATLPPALYALVEATPLAERLRASRARSLRRSCPARSAAHRNHAGSDQP